MNNSFTTGKVVRYGYVNPSMTLGLPCFLMAEPKSPPGLVKLLGKFFFFFFSFEQGFSAIEIFRREQRYRNRPLRRRNS